MAWKYDKLHHMVLTAFEVYKTENGTLSYNKTVKTDGNCIHYWKCFQVHHNCGHNILKRFNILTEVWLTKTKEAGRWYLV